MTVSELNQFVAQNGGNEKEALAIALTRFELADQKLAYWQKRCAAAEHYIDQSTCDPDIYPGQIAAYMDWKTLQDQEAAY